MVPASSSEGQDCQQKLCPPERQTASGMAGCFTVPKKGLKDRA